MTAPTRRRLIAAAAASPLAAAPWTGARAQADGWPARPVQLIIPAPAGGGVDVTARRLADGIHRVTGQNVVPLNRPGAAGLVGAQQMIASPPDGLTLCYMHSGHIVLQAIEGKPDMVRDVTPITMFSASQFCFAVHPESPHATMKALVDAVRREPGRLNYGAGGNGSPGHIAFEKLGMMTGGLNAVQVPFKGAQESVLAVAAKQIDFLCGLFSTALTVHRTGRVRIVAVTGPTRSPLLPDVPTVAEAVGVPAYQHVSWGALFGPSNMAPPLVARIDDVLRRVAASEEFKAAVTEAGGEPRLSASPAELGAFVKGELAETVQLMTRLGLRKA